MRLLSLALVLAATASAAMVKTDSTCVVTPLSNTPARSIGTVAPADRDVDPEAEPDLWADLGPFADPPPGALGALGYYPRPEPSRGSRPLPPPVEIGVQGNRNHHVPKDGALEARQTNTDDTPQMLDAFKQCGKDGTIIFKEGTYNIRQVMNTTDLRNCSIEIHGTFVWSADNIQYWLSKSFSVTYAGRSTAWLFGGRDVSMRGFGKALFNGNGQVWIDQNRNNANQNGRPISLTVWRGTNIFIDGITWRQAQFWHTFVAHSQNVTMTNLDMNTTSNSQWKAVNTDGTDTWNSKDVVIANWTVKCSDDCISVKGNSTNIYVNNVTCYSSGGMCVGSMGSNTGQPDYVDNVVFENVRLFDSSNAAWVKTYPGTGHVKNITFRNIHFDNVNQPIYVTSCIYSYPNCDSSRLGITDVRWENITGTSRYNVAVGIHCSSQAPCDKLQFSGIDIKPLKGGTSKILCSNIRNQASSGLQCTGPCPGSHPQQLSGNV
ncbi:polygalacturonase-like protein [Lasiosphaeria hispida]|uniref:Polygalacturonase-like protein n=1 Tax=Lasiosphaeria hispida TaxID=260671 RepID=A0AAJ0MHX0_9PEZI|nr:polygalacturonase-like protein [Lasiosphaeria hispida]